MDVVKVWSAQVAFHQNATTIQCHNVVVHVGGSPQGLSALVTLTTEGSAGVHFEVASSTLSSGVGASGDRDC